MELIKRTYSTISKQFTVKGDNARNKLLFRVKFTWFASDRPVLNTKIGLT